MIGFSPDGKLLALGNTNTSAPSQLELASAPHVIELRDTTTGRLLKTLPSPGGLISMVFAPDGSVLASGCFWDRTVRLWDVSTGNAIAAPPFHAIRESPSVVPTLAFSADGKLLAVGGIDPFAPSKPWEVTLWDMTTRQIVAQLPDLLGTIQFSPDDKLLVASTGDHSIRVWDVERGKDGGLSLHLRTTLKGHTMLVTGITFSPDGQTLFTQAEAIPSPGKVSEHKCWNLVTGKERRAFAGLPDFHGTLTLSEDGKTLVTGAYDGTLKLWDVVRSDSEAWASVKEQATLQNYNQPTSPRHTDVVTCVAVSPDGKTLATGSLDQTVKLWDLASGKVRQTLSGHTEGVTCLAFSSDGTLASGSGGSEELSGLRPGEIYKPGEVKLWDVATGRERTTLPQEPAGVPCLAFSPDGTTLAVGTNFRLLRQEPRQVEWGQIKLWDVTRGQGHPTFKTSPSGGLTDDMGFVSCLAFSPDGRTLATAGMDKDGGHLRLWDMPSGHIRAKRLVSAIDIACLSFSLDGRTLATGDDGRTVRLWQVATGEELITLRGHTSGVKSVAFSPDGQFLVTAGGFCTPDTMLRLWRAAPKEKAYSPDRK